MLSFQEKLTSSLENEIAIFLLSGFSVFVERHFELCNQPGFFLLTTPARKCRA